MRTLFRKPPPRRGAGGGSSFSFLAIGAVAILAVVFLLGFQVGRMVEKRKDGTAGGFGKGGVIETAEEGKGEVGKDLGAFSEEASRIPAVPPPSAKEQVLETERDLTFKDTLVRKNPEPLPLLKPEPVGKAPGSPARAAPVASYRIQAGAFREKASAEALRSRLERSGYPSQVVPRRSAKGTVHRVYVGPYRDKGDAERDLSRIRTELKIEAILVKG